MLSLSFAIACIVVIPISYFIEEWQRKQDLKTCNVLTYDFKTKKFYGG